MARHAPAAPARRDRIARPANVYLDRLDQWIEQRLLPEHNLGRRRRPNPDYRTVEFAIARAKRHADRAELRRLSLRRRQFPARTPPTRTTGGCGMSVMPMTGCWVRRPQARGRGNQGEDRGVPAR